VALGCSPLLDRQTFLGTIKNSRIHIEPKMLVTKYSIPCVEKIIKNKVHPSSAEDIRVAYLAADGKRSKGY
jgi:hypothetical protein